MTGLDRIVTRAALLAAVVAFDSAARAESSPVNEANLLGSVTLYASFDERTDADFARGKRALRTRTDHATEKGEHVFADSVDASLFRIAKEQGAAGGALKCLGVLPHRGRVFYPAAGNLAYDPKGWGGSASFWLNTNPNESLVTDYCDPIQITQQGAHDGGLWVDFPKPGANQPRDLRMGVFPALAAGEQPVRESDPRAPLVHLRRVPFRAGEWHHVALVWSDFDTGRPNARAALFVDGRRIGELTEREIAMRWNVDRTGLYVAVNYVGLFDELTIFDRPLTEGELATLSRDPTWVNERRTKLRR